MIKEILKLMFSPSGRITRAQYVGSGFVICGFCVLFIFLGTKLLSSGMPATEGSTTKDLGLMGVFFSIFILGICLIWWGAFATAVKRLHDMNLPGYLALLMFPFPFLGLLLSLPSGNPRENQYGSRHKLSDSAKKLGVFLTLSPILVGICWNFFGEKTNTKENSQQKVASFLVTPKKIAPLPKKPTPTLNTSFSQEKKDDSDVLKEGAKIEHKNFDSKRDELAEEKSTHLDKKKKTLPEDKTETKSLETSHQPLSEAIHDDVQPKNQILHKEKLNAKNPIGLKASKKERDLSSVRKILKKKFSPKYKKCLSNHDGYDLSYAKMKCKKLL